MRRPISQANVFKRARNPETKEDQGDQETKETKESQKTQPPTCARAEKGCALSGCPSGVSCLCGHSLSGLQTGTPRSRWALGMNASNPPPNTQLAAVRPQFATRLPNHSDGHIFPGNFQFTPEARKPSVGQSDDVAPLHPPMGALGVACWGGDAAARRPLMATNLPQPEPPRTTKQPALDMHALRVIL